MPVQARVCAPCMAATAGLSESARLIRDMTLCVFPCCQRARALNSSRCFKIKQKGAIMQLNQGKAAAYKAGLSPQ